MSKSTAQLRAELDRRITSHDTYVHCPGGGLVGSMRRLEEIKEAARELSAHLDAQPSRRGKPYRVTFQHQRGTLEGRIFNESHYDLSGAVATMRTVISCGGRVALSIRDDDGEYQEKDADYLRALGYADITDSGLYGDAHYSQER